MAELIHQHSTHVRTPEGELFTARTYGNQQADGLWQGWLEFAPAGRVGPTLRTERETTQPNRQALEYWSQGLEPLYFEGAFARAQLVGGG